MLEYFVGVREKAEWFMMRSHEVLFLEHDKHKLKRQLKVASKCALEARQGACVYTKMLRSCSDNLMAPRWVLNGLRWKLNETKEDFFDRLPDTEKFLPDNGDECVSLTSIIARLVLVEVTVGYKRKNVRSYMKSLASHIVEEEEENSCLNEGVKSSCKVVLARATASVETKHTSFPKVTSLTRYRVIETVSEKA